MRVAEGLELPDDFITQPSALLGMRGSGKSNAAVVIAEKMFDRGLPWVAIDPKGDWWGIRATKAGKKGGLPIAIFGGLHGDLPLEPESGKLMAELIQEHNLTCVLDVSEFSKGKQIRFLTDFGRELFRLHGRERDPRLLIMEEADEIVPQRVMSNIAECVGMWTKIVKQGRQRGLGILLLSQRSAVINKDALTQVENLIALRATSPQDRKAIEGWVDYQHESREIVDSLPGLDNGEAWFSSPHWLGKTKRIKFLQRATFDSGATPTTKKGRVVATLSDIDLGAIQTEMAETVERAKENDPKELKAKIRELVKLRDELKAQVDRPPLVEVQVEERIVKEAVIPGSVVRLIEWVREMGEMFGKGNDILGQIEDDLTHMREEQVPARVPAPRAQPTPKPVIRTPVEPIVHRESSSSEVDGRPLKKAERKILGVLAQFPQGRSKQQLSLLTQYAQGGTFNNGLGGLRSLGFINKAGDPVMITEEGRAFIGDDYDPLPMGDALYDYWLRQLPKAARMALAELVTVYPAGLSTQELALATGYEIGGTFNNALGRLRTMELVDRGQPIRANAEFMEAIS